MTTAIQVDHVDKRFRLYKENISSFKERVLHLGRVPFGDFYALQDISLEIPQGTTTGILGHNGSGKSTLLKCIAGILRPTAGQILVRGRVSALLELGAGFNPELTGAENVYLYASLLGMSRRETEQRFDEIVAFAELEKFIDQQVKYYSSGMYVRLGFAVAVSVDPDVLLVDEVLAVGDENFQRKCIERVRSFQEEGRTIVVVSHSPDLIRRLCSQAAVLDDGRLVATGAVGESLKALHEHLLDRQRGTDAEALLPLEPDEGPAGSEGPERTRTVAITGVAMNPPASGGDDHLSPGDALDLRVSYRSEKPVNDVNIWVNLHDPEGRLIFGYSTAMAHLDLSPIEGEGQVTFHFETVPLLDGEFMWGIGVTSRDGSTVYDIREHQDTLSILNTTPQIGLLRIPTRVTREAAPTPAPTVTADAGSGPPASAAG